MVVRNRGPMLVRADKRYHHEQGASATPWRWPSTATPRGASLEAAARTTPPRSTTAPHRLHCHLPGPLRNPAPSRRGRALPRGRGAGPPRGSRPTSADMLAACVARFVSWSSRSPPAAATSSPRIVVREAASALHCGPWPSSTRRRRKRSTLLWADRIDRAANITAVAVVTRGAGAAHAAAVTTATATACYTDDGPGGVAG